MSVGERIISILNSDKELTQKGLADSIGLATSTVNNWLKKGRDIPADLIIPICGYLGVSVNYLLTGVENGSSLTKDEQELLSLYRQLSDQAKQDFTGMIRIWLKMDGAAEREEAREAK